MCLEKKTRDCQRVDGEYLKAAAKLVFAGWLPLRNSAGSPLSVAQPHVMAEPRPLTSIEIVALYSFAIRCATQSLLIALGKVVNDLESPKSPCIAREGPALATLCRWLQRFI